MFINYNANEGISINSYRDPRAVVGDIDDVVEAVVSERGIVCCELEGAKDVLENGAYWNGSDATPEALEEIHAAICEHDDY